MGEHKAYKLAVQNGGGSINPDLNSTLRTPIDEAQKRNMPNATIQAVLKRCNAQSSKLKEHLLEIRHGFKVFIVAVLYTENLTNSKTLLASLHMFFDKGILEVVGNDKLDTKTADELEEIATEHAIECGAEELEIVDANTKHLTFICDPAELDRVKQKLIALGYNIDATEHNPITLSQVEHDAYEKFKGKLKAFDGVDAMYDNVNIED